MVSLSVIGFLSRLFFFGFLMNTHDWIYDLEVIYVGFGMLGFVRWEWWFVYEILLMPFAILVHIFLAISSNFIFI